MAMCSPMCAPLVSCGPCPPMCMPGPCGPCDPCAPCAPCGPCGPCGPPSCGPCGPPSCGPCGPPPCGPCSPCSPGAPLCGPCVPTFPCGPCGPCGPCPPPMCMPCTTQCPPCFPCPLPSDMGSSLPPRRTNSLAEFGNGRMAEGRRSSSLNGRSLEPYGKRNGLQGKTYSGYYDPLANYKNNYADYLQFKTIPLELYNIGSIGAGRKNGGGWENGRGRSGLFQGFGPGPIINASNPYDPCYPIKWKAPCFEKFMRNCDPCSRKTEYLFVKQTPVPALYPGPGGGEGARVEDLADMARQIPRLYAQNVCGYNVC